MNTLIKNEKFLKEYEKDIQAHIFSPHKKKHALYLFLKFSDDLENKQKIINFLNFLGDGEKNLRITSVQENNSLEESGKNDSNNPAFINIYLTAEGLEYFDCVEDEWNVIINHLRSQTKDLQTEKLNDELRLKNIHAVILLAHKHESRLNTESKYFKQLFEDDYGSNIIRVERGIAYRKKIFPSQKKGNVVEHFGYVDGLTNPWIREKDAKLKNGEPKSKERWNPTAVIDDFIIPEPSIEGTHYGSYLVYRKFEQNVKKFNKTMEDISKKTGFQEDEVGSFLFGRTKDGTPLELQNKGTKVPVEEYNDFKYETGKCPFFAHIRKANPRDNNDDKIKMIRRGITYGERKETRLNPGSAYELDDSDSPDNEVGLLFFSFVNNIENFQSVLDRCIDKETEVDPILGYIYDSNALTSHTFPSKMEGEDAIVCDKITGFVKLLDGLNLYMPSIHFFQTLHLDRVIV